MLKIKEGMISAPFSDLLVAFILSDKMYLTGLADLVPDVGLDVCFWLNK